MSVPDPSVPKAPRISGRLIVISFVIFIVVGVVGSVLLAKSMRPATMEARERVMPLAGSVEVMCVAPNGTSSEIKLGNGTCPKSAALTFAVKEPGRGVAQITFAVLTAAPDQPPLVGQFTREGSGRVELGGLEPGHYLVGFLYTAEPIPASLVEQAIKRAPKGDIPLQQHELKIVVSDLLKAKKEARLANLEFKVTP